MNDKSIHPKDFASKAIKDNLFKAIDYSLAFETDSIRHNTQTFNNGRYRAISQIEDYERLKVRAREIKENSIRNLPFLIEKLTETIEARGGTVFYAKDKKEAVNFIKEICLANSVKLAVKSKSITSEEIKLNETLKKENIEVVETDLAEFILQLSNEQPSHIVAPAIHRSRESISKLFKENIKTTDPLETGEELTAFASKTLREKFLKADVGITGANLISAEEGTILLVESEGNIRLTTHLPAIHIAIAGIEKIIPTRKDFGIFIELLAASATGQVLTSYTNILEPPLKAPVLNLNKRSDKERKFYLVLIDDGRMNMRDDPDLKEALYCIRCSACMNVCANFQTVGGHAFGGECYTGGIGASWAVGTTGKLEEGRFAELCTGCSRCIPNCPVKIDIPALNTVIKNRLLKLEAPSFQKIFFAYFSSLAKIAAKFPSIVNNFMKLSPVKLLMDNFLGVEKEIKIPEFPKHTFIELYKKRESISTDKRKQKIIVFADVFTNYNNPNVGLSAIELLDKLGIHAEISKVFDDGRAALSQGMIQYAEKKAAQTASYLKNLIDEGYDIIVLEPSVLAMIRSDYKKLLHDDKLFNGIKGRCFDMFEYLNRKIADGIIDINFLRKIIKPVSEKIFYHGHCQLKSIGLGNEVSEFFKKLDFNVEVSTQECCGMAGSFGYKKHYYKISKSLGISLWEQIKNKFGNKDEIIILASGTSCREQLKNYSETIEKVYHPAEYLNSLIDVKIDVKNGG
ncbi:LUD domain-containing protein [Melioribacter sp. OK-6-Me]|uniref:LUD domain-containing protein n=1 Tax=unclassified Melioribacter TaxID=2627329 RepID=UPI003ED99D66